MTAPRFGGIAGSSHLNRRVAEPSVSLLAPTLLTATRSTARRVLTGTPVYPADMDRDPLDSQGRFQEYAQAALDSLPSDLRARMSNVEVVVEEEPPPGQRLLGLYQGVPLTRRGSNYGGVLPDKITIYRGPLERLYAHDPERLRREVSRVVLHEVAHHFGISDERLIEIDRY
jgi:predicted Zn-dependent protease with MMP-like domain